MLSPDQIAWLTAYAQGVRDIFAREFDAAADRFNDGRALLDRFDAAIQGVMNNGMTHLKVVDEAHNELCVASIILANTKQQSLFFNQCPSHETGTARVPEAA